ncbi:hypothetical protein GGD81_001213 [Rhodobium orientis]|uniref:DUF5666 domain-containing protein n=1 Tax=Rhodobium orientis TaxID=34017 RepID=A0A327JQR6_9HYPH|nr:hypothetical protein [Rhodobium orientis]MBB4302186.1 hypothetical protein [Rhodobium orientis]MBK5948897.1 hypothetical protein [Rhodobium orientis]RAI27916.1 hypothetical protein CH339_08410 [Rhodobium orientis]
MTFFKSPGVAALAFVALVVGAPASYGFEPTGNPVADALFASLEAGGAKSIEAGSVSGDESQTEISDLKVTSNKAGSKQEVSIGSLVIKDATVEDGSVKAESIAMDDVALSKDDGSKLTIANGITEGAVIPSAEAVKAAGDEEPNPSFDRVLLADAKFTTENGVTIPVGAIEVEVGEEIDGVPSSGSMKVSDIVVSKDALDEEGKKAFDRFGYDTVTFSFSSAGAYDPGSGEATIKEIKVSGTDVGTLTITGGFGGLTPAVLAQLNSGGNAQQQMGALQAVSVQNLAIRFDDDSVTKRALAAQGKEMGGASADEVAEQLAAGLPMMLRFLQNKQFEEQVASAAGTFLRQQGSILIEAKPPQPVTFAQIFGLMMAPQALPSVLAVEVSNP